MIFLLYTGCLAHIWCFIFIYEDMQLRTRNVELVASASTPAGTAASSSSKLQRNNRLRCVYMYETTKVFEQLFKIIVMAIVAARVDGIGLALSLMSQCLCQESRALSITMTSSSGPHIRSQSSRARSPHLARLHLAPIKDVALMVAQHRV